jgi:hypothetical protein
MADQTLTDLIPDLYAALDVVSRELVGFIPSVTLNATDGREAVGEVVRVPISPAANIVDITPAMTTPEPTGQVVTNVPITITKSRAAEFGWVGEQQKGLNNGPGYLTIRAGMMAQAMRGLTNEVETDVASLYKKTSRAFGTAGTTPFASNLTDTAQVRKILSDNGAPLSDLQLVMDSTAGAAMRTLTQLTKANEAADVNMLRQGVLGDVHDFSIRESAKAAIVTNGTGTAYTSDTAGYAIGATVITLITGSGTILAGDVITFAGDPNKYVVEVGVAAPGAITLAAPGLREAVAASAIALTVGGDFTSNMAFARSALHLVTRAPALPEEGDMAIDRMIIQDDRSGLSFEVSIYPGYRKVRYEIAIAWGFENIKPEHSCILLG